MKDMAGDLAIIINRFVQDRPRRNRGINIDVFVSSIPFHELIERKGLKKDHWKLWIDHSSPSTDKSYQNFAIHYLGYKEDFISLYGNKDSFVIEMGDGAFCFISNFRRNHHDKVSFNLGMKLFPGATKAFLTSLQMFDIMDRANKEKNYDLRVRSDYFFERDGSTNRRSMEYHPSEVNELPTIQEKFKEKRNLRAHMRMCKLIASNKEKPLEITFSGDGHLGLYDGDFESIFSDFIKPIVDVSSRRINRFSGRSMSETRDKKPKPIAISFVSEPFSSTQGVKALLKHIEKYPHCTYSVIHSGNPHLYLYIMDREDFSTFSLRTLGTNQVIISPQIETSAESMARFTSHLLSNLNDGEIDTGDIP